MVGRRRKANKNNMKNTIAALSVVGLMIVAVPASASVGASIGIESKAGVKPKVFERFRLSSDTKADINLQTKDFYKSHHDGHKHLMFMGIVKTATASQLTVEVVKGLKNQIVGEIASVVIDDNTKMRINGEVVTSGNIGVLVGQTVLIKAQPAGSDEPAKMVVSTGHKQRIFGEITDVTENTVTVKNSTTGESTTVNINQDTKVKINGEDSEPNDIQKGDKVMIKIKAVLDTWVAKAVSVFR
jgi:hypothetical protein